MLTRSLYVQYDATKSTEVREEDYRYVLPTPRFCLKQRCHRKQIEVDGQQVMLQITNTQGTVWSMSFLNHHTTRLIRIVSTCATGRILWCAGLVLYAWARI